MTTGSPTRGRSGMTMTPTAKRWGIWCLPTKTWVNESTKANGFVLTDCTYATRAEAKRAMDDFTMKHTAKDYEVRKYHGLHQ